MPCSGACGNEGIQLPGVTGCVAVRPFPALSRLPKHDRVSDEIAAVPRVALSAAPGAGRRVRRGRDDGGDVVSTGPTTLPAPGDRIGGPAAPDAAAAAGRPDPVQAGADPRRPAGRGARAGHRPAGRRRRGRRRRHPGPDADRALAIDVSALAQDLHRNGWPAAAFLAAPRQPGRRLQPAGPRHRRSGSTSTSAERGRIGDAPAAVQDRLTDRRPPARRWTPPARRSWTAGRWRSPRRSPLRRLITDLVSYGDGLAQLPGDGRARRQPPGGRRLRQGQGGGRRAGGDRLRRARRPAGSTTSSSPPSWPPRPASRRRCSPSRWPPTPAQRALVDSTVTGDAVNLADRVTSRHHPLGRAAPRWSPPPTPPPPSARSST